MFYFNNLTIKTQIILFETSLISILIFLWIFKVIENINLLLLIFQIFNIIAFFYKFIKIYKSLKSLNKVINNFTDENFDKNGSEEKTKGELDTIKSIDEFQKNFSLISSSFQFFIGLMDSFMNQIIANDSIYKQVITFIEDKLHSNKLVEYKKIDFLNKDQLSFSNFVQLLTNDVVDSSLEHFFNQDYKIKLTTTCISKIVMNEMFNNKNNEKMNLLCIDCLKKFPKEIQNFKIEYYKLKYNIAEIEFDRNTFTTKYLPYYNNIIKKNDHQKLIKTSTTSPYHKKKKQKQEEKENI